MSAPRVAPTRSRRGDRSMFPLPQARPPAQPRLGRRSALRAGIVGCMAGCLAALLSACSGAGVSNGDLFTSNSPPPPSDQNPQSAIGNGQIKVGLLLPLSAPGNAGLAGQSMRNAAELALAEFNTPNIQLLVKDDAGTAQGAQQAAQQALDEGAEIIIGPLFAHSVSQVGQVARGRGVPVIAFSTDSNVAGRGVYLLSFLPEADVDRIVDYAIQQGKRSFVALVPDNAYGSVVEAEFKQEVARKGGRVVALERYPADGGKMADPAKLIAQAATRADVIFIPDAGEGAAAAAQALAADDLQAFEVEAVGGERLGGRRQRPQPQTPAGRRHRPVGRSAHFRRPGARGRVVRGAGFGRLPLLCGALPRALRPGSGAHRHARLRCGRPGGGAGEDPRAAALHARAADQRVGLRRHRRGFPLSRRRHQSARARGAAGDAVRRTGDRAGAADFRRIGDLRLKTNEKSP